MSSKRPTIVFFPEGAYGPTNNCVGIGDVLREHGARVVFVVEESFAGTLEAKGFEEALMRLTPQPEVEEEPGQYWKDFVRDTAPEFRKPTVDQLGTFIKPVWESLIAGSRYVNERLVEIFQEVQPDAIVEDNVVAFPAVLTSGVPWARIVSCNPLEVKDLRLPPPFSGYPAADPSGWASFRSRYEELHGELHEDFSNFCMSVGAPRLPEGEFMFESPYLNIYVYPREADYERSVPLPPSWHRVESCVRASDEPFEIPADLSGTGRLIYLSLGSLGSADVELMNHLVAVLGKTDHRVIVSMGPQHEQIELAGNMFGREFLPQTSILPMVDLVITHGGNNTVTECFHFGKPMIVLPLFWDQHDNAQRVDETGYGTRFPTYDFDEVEFLDGIERLLSNERLASRMGDTATRLQSSPGTERAAALIETLAATERSVTA